MLDKTDIPGLIGVVATISMDGAIHTLAGAFTAGYYALKIFLLWNKHRKK